TSWPLCTARPSSRSRAVGGASSCGSTGGRSIRDRAVSSSGFSSSSTRQTKTQRRAMRHLRGDQQCQRRCRYYAPFCRWPTTAATSPSAYARYPFSRQKTFVAPPSDLRQALAKETDAARKRFFRGTREAALERHVAGEAD